MSLAPETSQRTSSKSRTLVTEMTFRVPPANVESWTKTCSEKACWLPRPVTASASTGAPSTRTPSISTWLAATMIPVIQSPSGTTSRRPRIVTLTGSAPSAVLRETTKIALAVIASPSGELSRASPGASASMQAPSGDEMTVSFRLTQSPRVR